ncbi:MAG: DUF4878 domain-containing protein [Prevotella sp.]|jgi:hypothetical protein|nr:DUF4878 domain-containing protein [Prevotella sp.]
MHKITSILAVAAIALFAASCGGGSNSPAGIEKAIYSQMQKGNYEKAVEILYDNLDNDKTSTAEEKAQSATSFAGKAKQSAEAKGGVKNFEILEETFAEDGASATVKSKIVYGNGSDETQTTKYVKKDGAWKISLAK